MSVVFSIWYIHFITKVAGTASVTKCLGILHGKQYCIHLEQQHLRTNNGIEN